MSGVFNLYGIRNYSAKNNIAKIKKGDMALWYSSSAGKMIYGTMQAKDNAFVDKTSSNGWLSIDFIPQTSLTTPVRLTTIKQNKKFDDSNILKQQRISVINISKIEYEEILKIASTNPIFFNTL